MIGRFYSVKKILAKPYPDLKEFSETVTRILPLDQNTMPQKKIDLSPEEAVAVLNQLLGHEREKEGLNIKVCAKCSYAFIPIMRFSITSGHAEE